MRARITEEQKMAAVVEYARTGNLTLAAMAAKCDRKTLQREKNRSLAFREYMDNAKGNYTDALELLLEKRIRDPKLDRAGLLLMFALKANLPDKYREITTHKIDGEIKIISGLPRPYVAQTEVKNPPGRPRKIKETHLLSNK